MKEQKKKQLIVVLLLVSCFISGYMLFFTSPAPPQTLQSIAQADSLIEEQFSRFNISKQQISITSTRVDSNFSRKTYFVGLPYRFSKTQFHAELNNVLYTYDIKTPARVTFPEQNVNIQLSYKGTVIRTISLQTDPELSLTKNNITILLVFDALPDANILSDLTSLAEPMPIVLIVEQPNQVQELKKNLNGKYQSVVFWFQNQHGKDLIQTNPDAAEARLDRLQNISPNSNILISQDQQNKLPLNKFTKLNFIQISNKHFLHEQLGRDTFFEELKELQSNNRKHYSALITGTNTTISWLREELPDLKKSGMNIIPPKSLN